MCGIIVALNQGKTKEPVNQFIREQFEDQYTRGLKGFGAILINQDKTFKIFRATEPSSIHVDLALNKSQMILFHHRTPTSSDNYLNQTHPISIQNGSLKNDYLVIHNGIITNEEELKKKHEELGYIYSTQYTIEKETKFNDSESLATEVARYIENQTTELNIEGSYAFVALQIDKKTQKVTSMFFGRNTPPLNLAISWATLRLSSEGPGDNIAENILYQLNMINLKPTTKKFTFKKRALIQKEVKILPTTFGFNTHIKTQKLTAGNLRQPQITEYEDITEENADKKYEEVESILDDLYTQLSYYPEMSPIELAEYTERFQTILEKINKEFQEKEWEKGLLDEINEPAISPQVEHKYNWI